MSKILNSTLSLFRTTTICLVLAGCADDTSAQNLDYDPDQTIVLPDVNLEGMSLLEAMERIGEKRSLSNESVELEVLSEIFWAAHGEIYTGGNSTTNGIDGISGATNKRFTFHVGSVQEFIDVYYISTSGVYQYDFNEHSLILRSENNLLNNVDGIGSPAGRIFLTFDREAYGRSDQWGYLHMGMVSQNIYLACAANGLLTTSQGVFDRGILVNELNLPSSKDISIMISFGKG